MRLLRLANQLSARGGRDDLDEASQLRLFVDGLRSWISARLVRRHREGMTLEQDLSFLKRGTTMCTETGELGTVESVSLQFDEEGVPSLRIDLSTAEQPADDTVPILLTRIADSRRRSRRRDATVPYATARRRRAD